MPLQIPGVPVLDRACGCCCSLKRGSIVLGWLGMIASTFACSCIAFLLYALYTGQIPDSEWMENFHERHYWTLLVLSILWIVLNVTLLCGIHGERAKLMLPYLIASLFFIVFTLFNSVNNGVWLMTQDIGSGALFILVGLLIFVSQGYFWNVLYSFYRKLEEVQSKDIKYHKHVNQPQHYYAQA
ncbi:uncharacterized protein [Periplaneta americana]|uniref:uncharacterized protein n=1 Tax=Periplaneta americana TaxID=6978 RepID=UPI0037E79889